MEKSFSDSYKAAGVDVTAGYKAVELMKAHVARTQTAGSLSGIGGFGGLFEMDLTGMEKPVMRGFTPTIWQFCIRWTAMEMRMNQRNS